MRYYRFLYLLIIPFLIIQSCCDKIDAPYKEKGTGGDTAQVVKKILLEEFTGHKCPNCPTATKTASDLKDISGNQLIVIAIHAGFLAEPESSGNFTYDFTCTEGDELFTHYGIGTIGTPQGLVNRMDKSGSQVIAPGDWNATVSALFPVSQDAQLEISNNYNGTTRVLNTTVETEFFNQVSGPISLCVYITEDSIVSPQKNNDPGIGPVGDILDYVHMHVLRGSMNGTWGENLISGNPVVGQKYTKSYSITLDNAWDDKHCSVVAFVYYELSEEIIQAEEKHHF